VGDLIVQIDGETDSGIDRLQRLLDFQRIGRESKVALLRRAKRLTVSIFADERPSLDCRRD
jgi:S1-C subfamily serine protease